MHPSIEEFMTYPELLKRMLIFSKMSTKISFEFPLLTDTLEAEELMVEGLKIEKLLIFDRVPILLLPPFVSPTTSLAMRGLI